MFSQLQSNLIPGLNLNALGLFPSGAPGMGPSMPNAPPPGAYGGSSSFGVSDGLHVTIYTLTFHLHTTVTKLGLDLVWFYFQNLSTVRSDW